MIRAKVSNMSVLPLFRREIMLSERKWIFQTHFLYQLNTFARKKLILSMIRAKVSNVAVLLPFRRGITVWESK